MNRHLFSNLVSPWFAGLRPSGRRIPRRQTGCRPPRRAHLMLEQLEAREVPTSVAGTTPTFTQAAISLYNDGFQLGYNPLLLFANANNNATQADIALNTPYAQPFASLFVLAGEMAGHSAFSNVYTAISNSPNAHQQYATFNNSL